MRSGPITISCAGCSAVSGNGRAERRNTARKLANNSQGEEVFGK